MTLELVPGRITNFAHPVRFIGKTHSQRSDALIDRADDLCKGFSNELPPFRTQSMAVVRKLASRLINRLFGADLGTYLADLTCV